MYVYHYDIPIHAPIIGSRRMDAKDSYRVASYFEPAPATPEEGAGNRDLGRETTESRPEFNDFRAGIADSRWEINDSRPGIDDSRSAFDDSRPGIDDFRA